METNKKASISFVEGKAILNAKLAVDSDGDSREAAGAELKVFIDVPELLDEVKKDSAALQMLAKWFDANKALLPSVEKEL